MCDPITIASAAATAGSIAANASASSKISSARGNVLSAERTRQSGLDAEAGQLNTQSQDRYQNFGDQQTARAGTLSDMFRGTAAPPTTPQAALPASSSDIVNRAIANKTGDAKAFTDQRAGALGNLRSFGDLLGGISRDQGHDAQLIGQIGGFKKGSADASTYELESANHAGDQMKMFGDILAGVGKVGMSAGLNGGKLPFGSPTVTPGAVANVAQGAGGTSAGLFNLYS